MTANHPLRTVAVRKAGSAEQAVDRDEERGEAHREQAKIVPIVAHRFDRVQGGTGKPLAKRMSRGFIAEDESAFHVRRLTFR